MLIVMNDNNNNLRKGEKMKVTHSELEAFRQAVEANEIRYLYRMGWACQANVLSARSTIVGGRKYIKVDIGSSGRYMVEKSTGLVFGIKAYGQIHRGHRYGTVAEHTNRLNSSPAPLRKR
jgi:hypothetical protein